MAIRLLLLLSAVLLSASCATERVMGPPVDHEKTTSIETLDQLIRDHEKMRLQTEQVYRIGPGDVVSITLVDKPEILGPAQNGPQGGFTIGEDPFLILPLIGELRVHNKTAKELEADLAQAYSVYLKEPKPSVSIRTFQNNQIAVLGNVINPAKYPLQRNDVLQDAIFKAGGIRSFGQGGSAPGRYLKIYREKLDRQQRAVMGMDEVIKRINEGNRLLPRDEFTVPIDDFLITGRFAYNIPLMPNDIIWVPAAGSVMVYGRARNPGVIFLGPSLRTLAQVLTEAKGLRYGANSVVEIVRRDETGERKSYKVNARKILQRTELDFMLADGDEIWVFDHGGRVALEWIAEFFNRGTRAGISATYNPMTGAVRSY